MREMSVDYLFEPMKLNPKTRLGPGGIKSKDIFTAKATKIAKGEIF